MAGDVGCFPFVPCVPFRGRSSHELFRQLHHAPPQDPKSETRDPFSLVIKANQGSSNQTMKYSNTIYRAPTARPHTSPGQRPGFATHMTPALKGRPNPLIKAKKPTIVHNQGSSRQTMKFSNGEVGRVTPCAPSRRTQTLSLAGGGVQRTARPASHSPFATLRLCDSASLR